MGLTVWYSCLTSKKMVECWRKDVVRVEFKFSKKAIRHPEINKAEILAISNIIYDIVISESLYAPEALCCQIDVSTENQRWKFGSLDEMKQGLSPTSKIKFFDVLIGCMAYPSDKTTAPFSLYISGQSADKKLYLSSSGTSDVHAQELALKLEDTLTEHYKSKPSEAHSAESQSNTSKKFYQSPVFWAAAIVVVTLVIWAIDRFVLGK